MKLKANGKKIILMIIVAAAIVFACVTLLLQVVKLNKRNAELEARKDRLEEVLAEEESRREDLESEKEYVGTQEYLEEKARSIGYVYEDEIIFKKDE